MNKENQEFHALVELFGHTKIAGTITEHSFGPSTFIRVDVPETESQPAFTRLLNPSAIYAVNPVTKETMLSLVESIQAKPISSYDINEVMDKFNSLFRGQKSLE